MENTSTHNEVKRIVIVAPPEVQLMHAAGPCDVFSYTSKIVAGIPGHETAPYEIILASVTKNKSVISNSGMTISCDMAVSDITAKIDTLIIAGASTVSGMENLDPAFYTWLNAVAPYVRRIAAICTGAFVLAKAGLLNNRDATTHYEFCALLEKSYPDIKVNVNPFFVRDEKIYTSGGVSSGINLSLAMIEEDFGREIALKVARKLVLELRRPGNQAQFSNFLPAYELRSALVKQLRPWLMQNIGGNITVELMAEQANMSPRNFARVFTGDTGLTPAKFLEKLRIETARKYLEDSDLTIDQIADKCGFGSMVTMRRVFLRHLEISPSYYRTSFQTSLAEQIAPE